MGLGRTKWAASMFGLALSGVLAGRRIVYETLSVGDPSTAMNFATYHFRKNNLDRMIVIDADHEFCPNDVALLLSHDVPLVSGLYPKKLPGNHLPIVLLEGQEIGKVFDKSAEAPVEVARVPRGFLNVHRSVFDELEPHVQTFTETGTGIDVHLFWQGNGGGLSEDFAFCDLYRKHGGKVWCDHRIYVKHLGEATYPLANTP